jgi:acyl-coenzyme A synthetase/AMP-(fatty) acid ligase
MVGAMAVCLSRAMPVLLLNESGSEQVARFFADNPPGLIEALPNSFVAWEDLADDPRRPFASVKVFSSTFDAIHPRTISRLLGSSQRRAPLFFQLYGQSEIGPAVGRPYFARSAHKTNGRCVGWPVPGGPRLRVVARGGKRPSKHNPGFIEIRGEGVAKTYWAEDDRFSANLNDGWWRTGDVGYRTRLGCLHMLDREVDMIPGVGSSLEVEDLVMSRLGELSELAVVPGPGSQPVPVICTNGDRPLDLERWRAAVAEFPQLADPIQIPLAELPRTATLKVQRIELSRRLRERLGEGLGERLEERA